MKHVSKITAFAAFLIIAAVPATLAQSMAESMRSYVTLRVASYLVESSLIMH